MKTVADIIKDALSGRRSYGFNTYVRDGHVEPFDCGGYRGYFLRGRKVFDRQALYSPHCLAEDQMGKPHEMVLHIAGVMYYPTARGYVALQQQSD